MSAVLAGWRWVRADLRARPAQALLTVVAVAGIVTALLAGATLLEEGTNPWRALFAQTSGAHIWIHTTDPPDLARLRRLDGVARIAGPYRSAPVTVTREGGREPAALRALPARPPEVAHPVVGEGSWLSAAQPDGAVVERSFAGALGLRPGTPLTVNTLSGARRVLHVRGIADSAEQGFFPEWTPGLIWVLPETLDLVEPKYGLSEWVTGLRLADAGATQLLAQRALVVLGRVERVSTWREVRAAMELNNRLLGTLLALFGVVGLVAAALALANAAGGRVLGQLRDLATLKSLGFTRRQVTALLVAEHGALGLLGVGSGLAAGWLLCAGPLRAGAAGPAPGAAIAGGAALVVLAAVGLPAWRGGRTPPIPRAAVPPRGRLSQPARLALLVRLPPALVLGTRDAFTRRAPALLTAVGVAVPMMMITMGLGVWATLDNFMKNPDQVGQRAALVVERGRLSPAATELLLRRDPGIRAIYPASTVNALAPGEARSVRVRAIGASRDPYPHPVVAGRGYAAPGEAVAGQGLLDLLGVRLGDRVRLTVGGAPLIIRIVGRVIEPELDGQVLSVGLDTLAAKDAVPGFYALDLRPEADPAEVAARLLAASDAGLDVQRVVNPAERLGVIRIVVVALIAVLALLGLANLLTASALGLRDHAGDLAVLRAVGLTPRQVTATLVTATGLLVVLGVLAGAAVGTAATAWLIDLQGHSSGVGAGIGRPPDPRALAGAALTAVGAALAVAVIPARRAARAQISVMPR